MSKSNKSSIVFIIIGLILVVGGITLAIQIDRHSAQAESSQNADKEIASKDSVSESTSDDQVAENNQNETDVTDAEVIVDAPKFDAADILNQRIIGDKNASIKITEFSSLTCGHCGNFHKTEFKRLKEEYIDTGKAYLVFSDFPLNGPAVHASLASRCADQDKYFDMIQRLFETQDKWAYDLINYKSHLQNVSAEFGLEETAFESCINDKDLQKGLLYMRAKASEQYEINSTPSFVINDTDKANAANLIAILDEKTGVIPADEDGVQVQDE